MSATTRFTRLAAAAVPALVLAGCAAMSSSSYIERDFDPQRYRTYAWGADDGVSTGDPRLDNNEFFDAEVKADVDRALTDRGFVKASSGTPDLVVHYHANVGQEVDVRELDRDYTDRDEFDREPYVYDAGTLFVDLVDPATNRLVWRGWAEGSVDGIIDNQELLDRRIEEAVALIAEKMPRAM